MNIRAKFDGGKQYNRIHSGVWEGRCARAGMRQNLGPEWGTVSWEKITGKEANPIFKKAAKSYAHQLDRDRKSKGIEEVKRRMATKFRKTNDDSLQARRNYARRDGGPDVNEVHQDIPGDYLQCIVMHYYPANVSLSRAKALELESATRGQGMANDIATNLWMAERRKRITASVCGQIAKCRSTTKV